MISACAGRSVRRHTTSFGSCFVNALRVVGTGAAIGLVLAALSGRLIETMLFGVRPLDPMTFVLVATVLGITAALSIVGPAWRAARIDPAVALRNT